jgi:hypothetical protein
MKDDRPAKPKAARKSDAFYSQTSDTGCAGENAAFRPDD